MKKLVSAYIGTNLVIRIVIGLVIGLLFGIFVPGLAGVGTLGVLFVEALKAIAPIMVFLLVMCSLMESKGKIGKKISNVVILYLVSTLIAAFLAVVMSFLFPLTLALPESVATSEAPGSVSEVLTNLVIGIVSNPIDAVASGNYLSILFWSVIVGLLFKTNAKDSSKQFVVDVKDVFSRIMSGIIQFAPIGIFGLVYMIVSERGADALKNYASVILLLCSTMLIQFFVVNAIVVGVTIKANPYPLIFKCLAKSGITAFCTRSSAANIPVNMKLCEELKLDEELYAVSIPLGSTINMDGAAITITIMSIAAANTVGAQITIPMAIACSIVAALGACGTSGVTGGSLLLIPVGCALFGIDDNVAMQVVAVGFIISFIQDSLETALNSSSDVLYTAAVDFKASGRKKI